MSYTKHNFKSGDTLFAVDLAEMDEQIYKNNEKVSQLQDTVNDLKNNGTGGCLLTVETITIGGNTGGDNTGETIPVTSLTLDYTTLSLNVGDSIQLACSVNPSNATNTAITWESSNSNIATVDNGYVTALASGNVTITAKSVENTSIKANCSINVAEESSGEEGGTITVPFYTLDVKETIIKKDGSEVTLNKGFHVEIPYHEGMYIRTKQNTAWLGSYPPFVVCDGTSYTSPEFTTETEANTYNTTLNGYSENAIVYVNVYTNVGYDSTIVEVLETEKDYFYYSYET